VSGDYGRQAAGLAPLAAALMAAFAALWGSYWAALPSVGLGLTLPALGFCVVAWLRGAR
jgi:hypothetical protein